MNNNRHYNRPPITEAIIDIRVSPCASITLETLDGLCDRYRHAYPSIEPLYETRGMMHVRAGVSASASAEQTQLGFKCTSVDGRNIYQSRLNGLTFSRLAPYENWACFRDQAKRLWCEFREAGQPTEVVRLAVRYINRIDIPHQHIDLKDYFRTTPEVSPELPQQLLGFFMQLRLPQSDISSQVLINHTIVPPAHDDEVSVILDIDLFRSEGVYQDDQDIWAFLEELHVRKNHIFESCITDRTRELFGPCPS